MPRLRVSSLLRPGRKETGKPAVDLGAVDRYGRETNGGDPYLSLYQSGFVRPPAGGGPTLGQRVPTTSTSTRRSGCRQASSCGVAVVPRQSAGFVTGADSFLPTAEIRAPSIPPAPTR
jgi:hypothetical protein